MFDENSKNIFYPAKITLKNLKLSKLLKRDDPSNLLKMVLEQLRNTIELIKDDLDLLNNKSEQQRGIDGLVDDKTMLQGYLADLVDTIGMSPEIKSKTQKLMCDFEKNVKDTCECIYGIKSQPSKIEFFKQKLMVDVEKLDEKVSGLEKIIFSE
ncbi:hypothetical protein TUBRATIS_16090 [Tubulinosema ratisbonensis]|uniref:Uncharacterized protein n=1 Tax=Tubulinosema ratisbonensis TaxID=291195 RepID=A0A437ALC4_9MICR|nr:hypothetical protein TUBRATIS_16090 [Tubulinosema ratisbonensis]